MFLGLNVCTADEKKKCTAEFGDYLEWSCTKCEKRSSESISAWTLHILNLRRLVQAGYPFEKDDLSFEEWTDLGLVNEMLSEIRRQKSVASAFTADV